MVNEITITQPVQHLELYRGNSVYITVLLTGENDSPYQLATGDKLIFGIKKNKNSSSFIIKKILTSADELDGQYTFAFTPEDMNIYPCRYWYDVGLQFSDGGFKTVVHPSRFKVIGTVTGKEAQNG